MTKLRIHLDAYGRLLWDISGLLEQAHKTAVRSINSIATATYWKLGRRIVEYEQGGKARAEYGIHLLTRLAGDLTQRYGRGYSRQGLQKMRAFYLGWEIRSTPSGKFAAWAKCPTLSGKFDLLNAKPSDNMTEQELIPVSTAVLPAEVSLEFLNLKDEYSENDLEEALVRHLEWFLLELGSGFTFVARQKRIRIGHSWYRIDLLLYHRGLRCLVVIDLKTGTFTHADAGQMNLYLNYAKEHLTMPGESEPVGVILCSDKDHAVVKYATGGIRTRVFASKYLTNLPDEETLRKEILTTQRVIRARWKEKSHE